MLNDIEVSIEIAGVSFTAKVNTVDFARIHCHKNIEVITPEFVKHCVEQCLYLKWFAVLLPETQEIKS